MQPKRGTTGGLKGAGLYSTHHEPETSSTQDFVWQKLFDAWGRAGNIWPR